MVDGGAGSAKDQRIFGFMETKQIDNCVFAVVWRNGQRLVIDIYMLLALRCGFDPDCVALIALC